MSAHIDLQSVADVIGNWCAKGGIGRIRIVVESLYRMDGDFAPLKDLVAVAECYQVSGRGRGLRHRRYGEQETGLSASYEGRGDLVVVHAWGKVLGAAGALVTASGVLRNFMVNRCRPFIVAEAPSPFMAVAVEKHSRSCRRSLSGSNAWSIWSILHKSARCVLD
ncbi:7-keto-8-aminopelargonate synthetase-like enzyme [Bradyrhizobium sp. USDA 4486]